MRSLSNDLKRKKKKIAEKKIVPRKGKNLSFPETNRYWITLVYRLTNIGRNEIIALFN